MATKGRVVLTLEPRDSPGENTHAPFVGNWITNSRANQIGLNLPAMRAHDILRGVDLLAARSDVDPASIHAERAGRERNLAFAGGGGRPANRQSLAGSNPLQPARRSREHSEYGFV